MISPDPKGFRCCCRATRATRENPWGLVLRFSLLIGVQVLWFWLWYGNWRARLEPLPWLGVTLALAILMTPGMILQHILWHNSRLAWASHLSVGFAVSLALNGVLGLVGVLTHQSLSFVMNGMWLIGALAITLWFGQWIFQPHRLFGNRKEIQPRITQNLSGSSRFAWRNKLSAVKKPEVFTLVAALLALFASAAGMWLAIGNQLNPDDYGYNAYLTYYQHAPAWGLNEILFGTGQIAAPRSWIAFLPLYQALIAQMSGLSGVRLLATFLPPLFVLLSAFSTFTLARALGMRAQLAFTAVTVQLTCLLIASDQVQVGRAFYNRLSEDKAVVAFVLAPVLFYLTVEYFRKPSWRLLGLNMLVGLGMVWTHPTMTGLAYLIAGLYGLLGLSRPGMVFSPTKLAQTFHVLIQFALSGLIVLSIPLALRFVDTPYTRELGYDLKAAQLTDYQQNYLVIVNDVLYGLNPQVVGGLAFLLFFVAALVAAFNLKHSRAARFIVASLIVLVLAVVPLTGWLIGAAITAPHMDRVPWFTPFGIAIVFLVFLLLRFLKRRLRRSSRAQWEWAYSAVAVVIILAAAPRLVPPHARMIESLNPAQDESALYADYEALAHQLDVSIPDEAFVVAENLDLYNLVPGLTPKAHVVVFRNKRNMWVFGNLERDEIERRWAAWRRLLNADSPNERRMAVLHDFRITFVVSDSDTGWVHSLVSEYPAQFAVLGTFGNIRLYQFLPE